MKAVLAFFALMLVTAAVTQSALKTKGGSYEITMYITGAQHLEEVFATQATDGKVHDRVSSQVLRKFDFFVVEGHSTDFTVWGDKCRSCKIKRHFDASERVPKKLTIALREGR